MTTPISKKVRWQQQQQQQQWLSKFTTYGSKKAIIADSIEILKEMFLIIVSDKIKLRSERGPYSWHHLKIWNQFRFEDYIFQINSEYLYLWLAFKNIVLSIISSRRLCHWKTSAAIGSHCQGSVNRGTLMIQMLWVQIPALNTRWRSFL